MESHLVEYETTLRRSYPVFGFDASIFGTSLKIASSRRRFKDSAVPNRAQSCCESILDPFAVMILQTFVVSWLFTLKEQVRVRVLRIENRIIKYSLIKLFRNRSRACIPGERKDLSTS